MPIPKQQLMKPATWTGVVLNPTLLPIPPKVLHQLAVVVTSVFKIERIQPGGRNVLPREAKRWAVIEKLLQTPNVLRGLDIVHH